jgi:hypothetical protein
MTTPQNALVIERILRDREGMWEQVHSGRSLRQLIASLLICAVIALGVFGAVLGAQGEQWQIIASAVKLPVLFLLTLLICLPTLYLFNLVLGARLSVLQATALMAAAVTVTSVLTLAFAPISLFFLITAPDYSFYKLLNVAILALSGVVGLGFLVDGMRSLNKLAVTAPAKPALTAAPMAEDGEDRKPVPAIVTAEPQVNMALVRIWVLLFGFVGTQLAWTLRPFVGSPDQSFQVFRKIEGNFYVNVMQSISEMFS